MSGIASSNNARSKFDADENELRSRINTDEDRLRSQINADINQARADERENPASLSADPRKKVDVNRPKVDPPLKHVSMNKFLTYLVGGLGLLVLFYTWRLTVWANNAGGYWNLVTGRRPTAQDKIAQVAKEQAASAHSVAASAVSSVTSASSVKSGKSGKSGKKARAGTTAKYNNPHREDVPEKKDVETMVWELAQALGVKPAELSDAIRPLIDPTAESAQSAVKAAEAKAAEAKAAEAQAEATAAEAKNNEPGFLDVVEAFIE